MTKSEEKHECSLLVIDPGLHDHSFGYGYHLGGGNDVHCFVPATHPTIICKECRRRQTIEEVLVKINNGIEELKKQK